MSELLPGTVVGGVRVDAVTGRGGMGVVYRGTQLALKRTVALKVVRDDLAGDQEFRRRFTQESEIAASLDHPHIVPIHSAGEDQGRLYVTMRFVDGTDVREAIRRHGRLDPSLAAEIVAQVATALDAAHRRGLVHRDVKPANMLLGTDDGRPHAYLTDFGLSRFADSAQLTRTGTVVGTLDYMAPEQLEGRKVDGRVDVYALGCVLHQALTGSVPFPRDTEHAKMWAHMTEPPPRPTAVAGDLPAGFDAVVARALAKRPEDRYASAGELGAAAVAAARQAGGVPTIDLPRQASAPPTEVGRSRGYLAQPVHPGPYGGRPDSAPRSGWPPPGPDPWRGASDPGHRWGPPGGATAWGGPGGGPGSGPGSSHPSFPPGPPAHPRSNARTIGLVFAAVLVVAALLGTVLSYAGSGGGGGSGTPTTTARSGPAGTLTGVSVPVGKEPRDIETGQGLVFTANAGDGSVSRIDPVTGTARQIEVGGVPLELVAADGGVWVWNYSDAVTRVDIASGEVSEPIGANGTGDISGITAGGGFLWMTHSSSNSVSRIDLATRQATGTPATVGSGPVSLAYGNRLVYVANGDEPTITVLDGTTGAVTGGPIALPENPGGIAVNAGTIYVGTTDDVTPVDEASYVVGDPIPLEGGSYFLADIDGIWVSFPLEDQLRRLDLRGQESRGSAVPGVGKGIGDMVLVGDALWVSDTANNAVAKVQLS